MELISIGLVLLGLLILFETWRKVRDRKKRAAAEALDTGRSNDLNLSYTRKDLTAFLAAHGVHGDADIRNGEVYPPVDPSKLDPLAIRLRNAHAVISRLRNRNACSLYIMGSDGERPRLLDLDLHDIGEAASVMERVAADRRKSRALYRGMTQDEVTKLVRAGMSAFFKDDGNWGDANLAMEGSLDQSREFLIAREALELAFKVKGADV